MEIKSTKNTPSSIEGIDFNKIKIVILSNRLWLILSFILINTVAILIVRYTKNIYESETVFKLDVEKNASELGISSLSSENQNSNLISGEIEVLQSKLFLSRVLDSMDIELSFFSIGHLINNDLFQITPVTVQYVVTNDAVYNLPIYYEPETETSYSLVLNNIERKGEYGKRLSLNGIDLTINLNDSFHPGSETGYYFVINSRDALLNYLSKNLTVEPLNLNANTLRASFKDYNSEKAQFVLSTIDNLYLSYSNEQKSLANKQKIDWVTSELSQIEKKMENYENYFEAFILDNKTNNLDEDLKYTIKIINNIDSQRYTLNNRIASLNKLFDELALNNFSSPINVRNDLPQPLINDLLEIQKILLEEERLKLSYNETTFAFREKEMLLETLKRKTGGTILELKNKYLKTLLELNQKKSKMEADFARMPDKMNQYNKNERYYKLYEEFYLSLMKSKSDYEIAKAGTTPDFKILTPATHPNIPISPRISMIIGIGISFSFIFLIFFIGISYLLNNKITSLNEIESIGIPVLGVIPSSKNLNNEILHILDHPKSMVCEAIRIIRTNLDFFNVESSKKVIAISSTISGEGKSFIAMNMAGIIAQSRKKVILLDLDMRKPKRELPIHIPDRSKGVSTILIKKNTWTECRVETSIPSFDYIPSGPHPPNPSELLLSHEFHNLLEDLKLTYDFIILDTPPVGLVTDGIMAMKKADISIYLFRANYSKKDFLFNLKRIIKINKFTNITMLLNALPEGSERGYGYGYYEEPKPLSLYKSLLKKK